MTGRMLVFPLLRAATRVAADPIRFTVAALMYGVLFGLFMFGTVAQLAACTLAFAFALGEERLRQ